MAREERDLDQGLLRFLIRTVDGGEVSHYLARLGLGDTVELRGPHLGFDVPLRMGNAGQLVFLAGGTGIAPALQAIRAVLDRQTADPGKSTSAAAEGSLAGGSEPTAPRGRPYPYSGLTGRRPTVLAVTSLRRIFLPLRASSKTKRIRLSDIWPSCVAGMVSDSVYHALLTSVKSSSAALQSPLLSSKRVPSKQI